MRMSIDKPTFKSGTRRMEAHEVEKRLSIDENQKKAAKLAQELRLHKARAEEEENLRKAEEHKALRNRMLGGDE